MRFLIPLIFSSSLVLAIEDNREQVFDRVLDEEEGWTFHLHTDYESRYVLEGRDSLDGDGLATATFEAAWNVVSVGMWYGISPDQSYDEFQISTAVSGDWRGLEWHVACTHLRFLADEAHDTEIGTGVSWAGLPWGLALALDANYSTDAEGAFLEATLDREFRVFEHLRLTPSMAFGMNQGFVADGHDGANHIALRFDGEYPLTRTTSLVAHIGYNFAIDSDADEHPDDELLRDFLHVGIGLRCEF